jgi:chorismate mutase/GNAT superfamily N-acetyltransferase
MAAESREPDAETDLVLRRATAADLPEIAELFVAVRAAAVPAMPPLVGTRDEVVAHVLGWSVDEPDGREVWLAEDDIELVGYLVLTGPWVDGLYVDPARQGGGVGSALLDLAKARRPGGFALWVFASNAPARGFYHRHGLVELEHTDGAGNLERSPDVRMAWPGEDPLRYLRGEIDAVDDELALLLARRFALVAAVQGHKEDSGTGGGHAGRDPGREEEILHRMARHTPGLAAERIEPILDAVITESLTAWESGRTER